MKDHSKFIEEYPELHAILADYMQALLIHKPEDTYKFAREFFAPFSPILPPQPSHLSHSFK